MGFVVLDIAAGTKGLNKASNTDEIITDLGTASNRVDDFAQQVHRWGDSYSQQVNARLIADGGRNVDDLPTPTAGSTVKGTTAAENVRTAHWNSLTESERSVLVSRLSQSSNPEASVQFLNAIDDTADVRFLLDGDVSTLNRLTDWHANPGSHRYIDPDVSANDFVHVTRNSEIEYVKVIVQGPDQYQTRGSVQWLEEGSSNAGLEKIIRAHGDDFQEQLGTSSHDAIQSVIYQALKNPQHISQNPGGGTRYYIHVDKSEKPIRVVTGNNGFTINAFPDSSAPI